MRLTMTEAWIVLGGLALFLVTMAIVAAWDLRRKSHLLLVGLNAMRFSHGPVATRELAERYGIGLSRTRHLLEDLFRDGWISRYDDEETCAYWRITEAGVAYLKRLHPELRSLDA